MGAYGSQFKEKKDVPKTPKDPSWIVAHAKVTGLEIPEIERLWKRFQLLGCNNFGELVISNDLKEISKILGEDAFVKNILRNLKSATGNSVTFLAFVNFMKFSQIARLDDKIRAVFQLLNKGSPINEDILFKVLKHVYPTTDEQALENLKILSKKCIQDMSIGTNERDAVNEEAFVNYMKRFPKGTLSEILACDIIPIPVRRDIALEEEAEKNKELHAKKVAEREKLLAELEAGKEGQGNDSTPADIPPMSPIPKPLPSGKPLTDELLLKVTQAIPSTADWNLLANRLGFLQRETEALEVNFSESREKMIHAMLKAWRNRGETASSAPTLQRALQYCRMEKAAQVLAAG